MSATSISFTVHPSALGAEYLTVSDAMKQILDLVEALEHTEADYARDRQIVWRLTDAHTNSPPFSVTAEAFPIDPALNIDIEAMRVSRRFASGFNSVLQGQPTDWLARDTAAPVKRVLERNLNGIGLTEVQVDANLVLDVVPANAKIGVIAIERAALEWAGDKTDERRTEYGSIEIEIAGLGRWYDKPSLTAIERLSRDKVNCVLSTELAEKLGAHQWHEAWVGGRLLVTGALQYAADGSLSRIDADDAEELPWTDVPLSALKGIDLLEGRSVSEHLKLLRGDDIG